MSNTHFLSFDPSQEGMWIAAGVGALLTLLVLVVGYLLLDRRGAAQLAPRSAADPAAPTGPKVSDPAYDPFVDGSALEQRTALRRKGNSVLVEISDADAKAVPTTGWVIDRSTSGLCLLVDEPQAVGRVLSVKASNAPKGTMWVQVEVKNSRQKGKGWEIGCHFLRPPPWGIMLLFG